MKQTDFSTKERCRMVRERYGIKHDPALDKEEIKPSIKTLQANESLLRYGLPSEYYERMKEQL